VRLSQARSPPLEELFSCLDAISHTTRFILGCLPDCMAFLSVVYQYQRLILRLMAHIYSTPSADFPFFLLGENSGTGMSSRITAITSTQADEVCVHHTPRLFFAPKSGPEPI
jgi:hypothetical protein